MGWISNGIQNGNLGRSEWKIDPKCVQYSDKCGCFSGA